MIVVASNDKESSQVTLPGFSICVPLPVIDLVTVFDAILSSRQTCEKLQCLYEKLMSNNLRRTAVLKKISIVN